MCHLASLTALATLNGVTGVSASFIISSEERVLPRATSFSSLSFRYLSFTFEKIVSIGLKSGE